MLSLLSITQTSGVHTRHNCNVDICYEHTEEYCCGRHEQLDARSVLQLLATANVVPSLLTLSTLMMNTKRFFET
jgi:hypothetical protein